MMENKLAILKYGEITKITGLEAESEVVHIFVKTNHEKEVISRIEFGHDQDCCELVRLYEYHGSIQAGEKLIDIKVTTDNYDEAYESGTWTFITIETDKSTLTLRFLGESNGYYSEEVDIEFTDLPRGMIEVDGRRFVCFDRDRYREPVIVELFQEGVK